MRTPLTSISTYSQLLADDPGSMPPASRQLLEIIRRNTGSLTAIIDDLLDLAALESGHVTLRPEKTDLAQLVREAVESVRATADDRSLTLRVEVPAELQIRGDAQRLRQVFDNLFSNAVKYNHEAGRITVELHRERDEAVLRVTDTGIGVPIADRPRLFERFFRSSNVRDSGIPGTGLGLSVSSAIVAQHGGRLSATHHDPGTTLTVRLPASPNIG
ncbi:sensor histidine kinase [Cryptosporangium phraense]|uniref:histidine kinase n=1 Tax=Cryptosporangium phraense TaxID=2593070 RepID=A0A545AEP4_9ACTN|nr:HAMP domain-containing sensor histidine kinase [Cryptosporangium phraense]TQS39801.1 HAMP domain-containing histidine kinase [Cryptosporangium phraense]